MESVLLHDIIIIFGLSIAVLLGCYALRLPPIVGFILTGVLSGPHGFGLVNRVADVESLANIGIILLLFSIGMEFSLKKLNDIKRYFFLGGLLQVALTIFGGFLVGYLIGRPAGEALFLGFILSLSSTAIVLRILENRGEMDSPHGKVTLSILIFQDFIAIPMMLAIPFLGTNPESKFNFSAIYLILKGVALLIVVFISAQNLVPRLMYYIAKTRSRELFLLTILTICFSVALLAENVGLSLSLGAFLAGLIVSDTEYSHQAISDILPFKEMFTSVFFVSIGMLLDISFVKEHPFSILFITLGVLLLKSFLATLTTLILGMPIRTAVLTGIALSQVGEFSLILVKSGFSQGIGNEYFYQLFLAVALFTMAVTPTLMNLSSYLAGLASLLPLPHKIVSGLKKMSEEPHHKLEDHLIIVGFGVGGKNLAKSAKDANIPYFVIEMNPETVKKEKVKGEPIHFGDGTHEVLLGHGHIKNAKAVAVLINDPVATLRVAETARKMNPEVYIIARTHYMSQAKAVFYAGADDVIADELGSSIEVLTKVLERYDVGSSTIEKVTAKRRGELFLKEEIIVDE